MNLESTQVEGDLAGMIHDMLLNYTNSTQKSINNIAMLTGIDRRTIKKIEPGYDMANVAPAKIARLIKLTSRQLDKDQQSTLMSKLPEVSTDYKHFFTNYSTESVQDIEHEKIRETISADRNKFLVYSICTMQSGTTLNDLINQFGQNIVNDVEELIDLELITLKNDRYYSTDRGRVYFDAKNEKNILSHLASMYNYKNANQKRNIGIHAVESINLETLRKCHEILLTAFNEVSNLVNKEENKGDIQFFAGTVMDTFQKELPTKGLQQ